MTLMTKTWVLGSQPNGPLLREVFLSVCLSCLLLCQTDAPVSFSECIFSLNMWTYWKFTYMEVATFSKKKKKQINIHENSIMVISRKFNHVLLFFVFMPHLLPKCGRALLGVGTMSCHCLRKKDMQKTTISVFFVWKILNHILRQLLWHLLCPSGSLSQEIHVHAEWTTMRECGPDSLVWTLGHYPSSLSEFNICHQLFHPRYLEGRDPMDLPVFESSNCD